MCGICGCLNPLDVNDDDVRVVRGMMDDLAHRGPDADGLMRAGPVVLGHRRLSVVDLSPEANQPMFNEDGSIAAIVNGEIYNYRTLRDQLMARGHRFRSHSDSEVIVHLYEEQGIECLARLRGMFAIALWDARRRQLFLVRDRLGKKPLYYASRGGRLYFASELGALHRALPWPTEVDLDAADQYLTLQYVPAPLTVWAGVKKLPAGHLVALKPGEEPRPKHYYHLSFAPSEPISLEDAAAEVRALVEESVKLRTASDVPYGAFLSGGLDSSSVVATLARIAPRPVKTFTIDFPWGDGGEARYARLVADRYQTEHHELTVTPDMVAILPGLVKLFGEPFGDPSAVPTYYLAQFARQSVTVALSGDGADEAFAGYTRYSLDRLARLVARLPRPLPRFITTLLAHLPGPSMRPVRELAAHHELSGAERYLFFLAHFTRRDKEGIVGPALKERAVENRVVRDFDRILAASDAGDAVSRLLDLDIQTYLPDDIFTKVDMASMAHALEVRAPFSDHVLHERVARLSGALKLRGFRGKHLLRRAVRDLLPAPVLARRKQGFGLPLARWMRGELAGLARDILTDQTARSRGLLEPAKVLQLLDQHQAGVDHGERLWNLMVLELWFREFVDRPKASPAV